MKRSGEISSVKNERSLAIPKGVETLVTIAAADGNQNEQERHVVRTNVRTSDVLGVAFGASQHRLLLSERSVKSNRDRRGPSHIGEVYDRV